MEYPRDKNWPFKTAAKTFDTIDGITIGALIASACDLALLIDKKGAIKDISIGTGEIDSGDCAGWAGKLWIDTVAKDSRGKVTEALQAVVAKPTGTRWRHINQITANGSQIPVSFRTVSMGTDGKVLAIGRDLRTLEVAQQRLIDAQRSTEREYVKFRHAETRYRFLFQMAGEAIVIVDLDSGKVSEVNPKAAELLGQSARRVAGRAFTDMFAPAAASEAQTLLLEATRAGRAEARHVKLAGRDQDVSMRASLFQQETASYILVHISPIAAESKALPQSQTHSLKALELAPEGFVITGLDGRILSANRAFLGFAELATEEQARGQPFERFLGRPGIDFKVLVTNVREHGTVRMFSTNMRGIYGTETNVEISGVAVPDNDSPCLGFVVHNTAGRVVAATGAAAGEFPRSVDQMRELVGSAPLKEIVRETTDVIERLCIEAALELTGDNRASAAEMLGISRQSFYDKLRRHGLGELNMC